MSRHILYVLGLENVFVLGGVHIHTKCVCVYVCLHHTTPNKWILGRTRKYICYGCCACLGIPSYVYVSLCFDALCVHLLGILQVSTYVSDSLYACIHIPVSRYITWLRTACSTCLSASMSSCIHTTVTRFIRCLRTACPNCLRISVPFCIHIPMSWCIVCVGTRESTTLVFSRSTCIHIPVSRRMVCLPTATHCNTLQHTATHHSTPQHTTVPCKHTALPYKSPCLDACCVYLLRWLHFPGSLCLHVYLSLCLYTWFVYVLSSL